jgi:hypothetical protein
MENTQVSLLLSLFVGLTLVRAISKSLLEGLKFAAGTDNNEMQNSLQLTTITFR